MTKMKNILVATDFSDNSSAALSFAFQMAKQLESSISLIYVYDLPVFERFLVEEEVKTITLDKLKAYFEKFMNDRILPEIPDADTVPVSFLLEEGNVHERICKAADDLGNPLVIMGSHGSGSGMWEDLWMGGTTQKVIRRIKHPLLVVPPSTPLRPVERIGYATDLQIEDIAVTQSLISFTRALDATIYAVHIIPENDIENEAGLNYLRTQFAAQVSDGILRFEMIRNNHLIKAIQQYVKEKDLNMVAVMKEKENFIESLMDRSVSLRLSVKSSIPVLILKEK